ncbi:EcsC family protein [Actinoplanes bogorensis]|uniref:EcsC family protein n=1 Tax=Paractinoplanes bogorensis TaxID=1610840 RepID=A0ABS5YQ58_9ACTN|nr:EcsC family protein [Actinoplanes bogorensis]MBU2665589.1 EcsC family protein [Actinoplanes bogorensis]
MRDGRRGRPALPRPIESADRPGRRLVPADRRCNHGPVKCLGAGSVMSADTASAAMSPYEGQVWQSLNEHWERRNNRRGLPNWASTALDRTGGAARSAADRASGALPEVVKQPFRVMGDAVTGAAVRPTVEAATKLLELVNSWADELNDPKGVQKIARKRGLEIDSFLELRQQDLKACDRLLTRNTLKWQSLGALEGAGMGLLAMVPVGGFLVAMTADILVVQVLSRSIASRIAYSYGYDAKDPAERAFIDRLVTRSFLAQAAKAGPLNEAARAAHAIKGRVRWSDKLRTDHRLLAAIEKLMQHLGPAGAKASVTNVAKVVPFVGVVVGAGTNAAVLGRVAADAQRYCQTRFLCDKYGLPLPAALLTDEDAADE